MHDHLFVIYFILFYLFLATVSHPIYPLSTLCVAMASQPSASMRSLASTRSSSSQSSSSSYPFRASRRYLLQYSVTERTSNRYNQSVAGFLKWVDDVGEDASSTDALDELLLEYFHELYETDRGKSLAKTTFYGILLHMPQLKYQLHASHQALRAWERITPQQSYPPLTWEHAVIIAIQMTRAGYIYYGIGVLLAFDSLLRVSELCNLIISDIADDGDSRVSVEHKGMIVHLRSTKTGKNQWVTILDPSVKKLIRWLISHINMRNHIAAHNKSSVAAKHKQSSQSLKHSIKPKLKHNSIPTISINSYRLFPFSPAQFRRILKLTCINLGLSDRYVPHSLRHGGATRYHHVHKWSIEDVLERGRWQSVKSARRYIQAGVAMLMNMSTPSHISANALTLARNPYRHIIQIYLSLSQKH